MPSHTISSRYCRVKKSPSEKVTLLAVAVLPVMVKLYTVDDVKLTLLATTNCNGWQFCLFDKSTLVISNVTVTSPKSLTLLTRHFESNCSVNTLLFVVKL